MGSAQSGRGALVIRRPSRADSADGVQQALVEAGIDLLAQLADMHVDDVGLGSKK